jgi:hypothetical protein
VTYLKGALSAVAAMLVALLVAGGFLKGISEQKATGLGAVAGGLGAALLSPLFWVLAISSYTLLFAAGRLTSKALRVLLFWAPTLVICTLGVGLFALYAYALVHSRNG